MQPLSVLLVMAVLAGGGAREAGPSAPCPLAPADGAAVYMAVPSFRWEPALEPDPAAMPSYVIQIASDARFANVADEDRLPAVITHYVPDRPLPEGVWNWRVAALDAKGRPGPWSKPRTFTIRPGRAFRVSAGASFSQIRQVLTKAAAATPARVAFEKATYRLDPGGPRALIELAGAADLTIDGGGSTVVLTRPAPIAKLDRCRRVMVSGFVFDYDPPVYTAGRVVAVDERAGTIDVEILPGHSLPGSAVRYNEDRKGMIVTEAEGFAIKRGSRLVVTHSGFERVRGRRCRFRFDDRRSASQFDRGDVYVLGPRWQQAGGGTSFRVRGGEQVVFHDLTIHGAANECLNSFYADRHSILHVRLKRRDGRALSVNNGGNNHHNARRGPWIEGCLFENTGDDVCHVNGYAMSIEAQPAPDRLRVRVPTPYDQFCLEAGLDFRPGDRLQLFTRRTGRLLGERRIEAVTRQGRALAVRLDGRIEGVKVGRLLPAKGAGGAAADNASITRLFNASRGCSQFVFRNNTCRSGRRVGVLAKGDGGLIEGNLFENLGGGGVEFWNAPFEGLAAENYVVRNNRIVNCLRLSRKHAGIWCTAFRPGGSRIHRNLLIEGNEIVGAAGPAVDVGDAEHVLFRGNRIVRPRWPDAPGDPPIRFRNVGRLVRESNQVSTKGPGPAVDP